MLLSENPVGEVAFGLSYYLPAFKQEVPQAQNYMDLGIDPYLPDFVEQVSDAMHNATHIHFNLTEMYFLNTPDGVLHGPVRFNPRGSTNWELRTIWDDPVLRTKTTFYRNGKTLSLADITKLD